MSLGLRSRLDGVAGDGGARASVGVSAQPWWRLRLGELFTFGLVGVVAALFHYGTLIGLVELAGTGPVPASAAGFVVGGLVSYWLNYHWTFRSTRDHGTAMPTFFLIALVGLGLNTLLMALLTGWVGLQYVIAQVLTTAVLLFWHLLANRRWTFS